MTPRAPALVGRDLQDFALIRRVLRLRAFQFLVTLPTAALVAVVLISTWVGIEHPGFNFGIVFTWVVWWGALLLSLVFLGRAWCLACPVGAVGEWIQRLSLWWRSSYTAGYHFRWPRLLRNMWLPTALFVVFIWLDNGLGIANSPRLTAALIAILLLGAAWVDLFFERRTFCRYVCPLTSFIGVNALVSVLELRARDREVCRTACPTKDCFRGNSRNYGCPMVEFPGAMDTNLNCILCTECVKGCPHDNVALRLRAPGRDLWAMTRPRLDGAASAAVIVGLATIVPLLTMTFLPDLRGALAGLLPGGDAPRLVAVAILFAAGIATSVALVYAFSHLSRLAAGDPTVSTRALFARYAYALIPVGLAKYLADLLDHLLRTWGALADVTRALAIDFPFNRAIPGRVTVVHLLGPSQTYLLQAGLLLAGLLVALYAAHRISLRVSPSREAAFASFLPMAGLGFVLTLVSLWTLGIGFF